MFNINSNILASVIGKIMEQSSISTTSCSDQASILLVSGSIATQWAASIFFLAVHLGEASLRKVQVPSQGLEIKLDIVCYSTMSKISLAWKSKGRVLNSLISHNLATISNDLPEDYNTGLECTAKNKTSFIVVHAVVIFLTN